LAPPWRSGHHDQFLVSPTVRATAARLRSYVVKPGKSWGILLKTNKQNARGGVYLSRTTGVRSEALAYTVPASREIFGRMR
jgi:hypothetical protein